MTLLNPADRQLPFQPSDIQNLVNVAFRIINVNTAILIVLETQANEDLRARYRYLDLRRDVLAENIRKRSKVTQVISNVLIDQSQNPT